MCREFFFANFNAEKLLIRPPFSCLRFLIWDLESSNNTKFAWIETWQPFGGLYNFFPKKKFPTTHHEIFVVEKWMVEKCCWKETYVISKIRKKCNLQGSRRNVFFLSKTKISFDFLNNCFKNFSFIWSDLGFCIYASGTKGISMRVHVVRSICTFAIVFISNYFQAA